MPAEQDKGLFIDELTIEYLSKCAINMDNTKYNISTVNATIMVFDIHGFTALSSRAADSDVCEIIRTLILSCLEISLNDFCHYVKTLGDGVMLISEGDFNETFYAVLDAYRNLLETFKDMKDGARIDGIGLTIVHGTIFKYEIPAVRSLGYKDYFGTPVNFAFRLQDSSKGDNHNTIDDSSRLVMPKSTYDLLRVKPSKSTKISGTYRGIDRALSQEIYIIDPRDFATQ